MRKLTGEIANRFGVRGVFASVALLLAYFVGDAVIHEEAAELGYAFAILAVVGSAAGFGYLIFCNFGTGRRFGGDSPASTFHRAIPEADLPTDFEEVPASVSERYASFSFLFSGLAGWVEARRWHAASFR